MARQDYLFTSESVSEGHPDKVCDRISDEVVDLFFREGPKDGMSPWDIRAACETLATTNRVIIAGETRGPKSVGKEEVEAVARAAIKEHGVDVRYYSIIYEAIDDIKAVLTGMLSPEVKEAIVGLAEVRSVFRSSKFGTVAGCMVIDGYVRRNFPIRVLRNNVVIFEGALESLKRFKDDVTEVRAGTECGIGVKNYNDVQEKDQIECYSRVEVARTL